MNIKLLIIFCLAIIGLILILCYRKYSKLESPTILISSMLSLSIVIIFLLIISSVYTIYTGVGELNMEVTGQVGDFIGGVVGTILTALSIVLLYNTLQAQNKSSQDQADQFNKSQIENRFFELLKFHRDNVNEIEFHFTEHKKRTTCTKGRHFFVTANKQLNYAFEEFEHYFQDKKYDLNDIYEADYLISTKNNTFFIDRKIANFYLLAKIDICYLIFFYGVSKNGRDEILEKTNGKYKKLFIYTLIEYFRLKPSSASTYYQMWKILYDNKSLPDEMEAMIQDREDSLKQESVFLNNPSYYPDNYNKFYGGHQFRLGHYFRHLYQIVCYVHYNKSLSDNDKKNYIRILRGQLSDYEQKLFFYNSLSQMGRVWEIANSSGESIEAKDHLISIYNIIKNIDNSILIDDVRPNQFYK